MIEHYSPIVVGTADTTNKIIEVRTPYAEDLLATVELANAQQVEQALATAYATFRDKSKWLSVDQRCEILERVLHVMSEQFEDLAVGAASEGGKPLIDSRVEVARAIDGVKLCIETIRAEAGNVIPMSEKVPGISRMAFTQKEPIGVVVAVSAFNHPLNLIVHQVGAAIAAGCPTIVKPAQTTPLSCFRFVKILHECGLPDNYCQSLLPESTDLATALVTDSRVGFFSFIGSARVGWMLRSKLAPGTRCALEHGGIAPVIVDKSANIDKLIPSMLKGGYYHAGQVCVSVQRIFVHSSQFDEVAERLAEGAVNLKVGNSVLEDTEVGPLISPDEVERVHRWVTEAIEEGATMLVGGKKLPNNCYQPTLLLNPKADSKVSTNEVFGPVVCLYAYEDIEQAIAQANNLDVAFQASVFTQDIDRAIDMYHKLDASAVMINDNTTFRQDAMPFAGLKHSGHGVGGIPHTIEDMQIEKMMVIRSTR